ncbi:hypothetical protein AWN76_012830 [Rhodothermaceae bacterium RA]|nr:hypothetical protein AWN76_012830 [Rhodothermaceae bacterium RA]
MGIRAFRWLRSAAAALGLLMLAGGLTAASVQAQAPDGERAARLNPYGSGMGFTVLLTNSGFGLGGYYHRALSRVTSFSLELSLAAGKDEREVVFFDFFGRRSIPRKANFFLMMPIQIGLQRRLFQESIQDNFRPYLQIITGPTLGWEYPYFDDANGNGLRDAEERTYDSIGALPRGTFRLGYGGMIALGAHFGLSRRMTQGIRLGYAFSYVFDGVQLLEPAVQPRQHGFGTPTISLTFGRLF